MLTTNKPYSRMKQHNVQLICWISSEFHEQIKQTLKRMAKFGIKATKSELIRMSLADELSNLNEFLDMLIVGGVYIDE